MASSAKPVPGGPGSTMEKMIGAISTTQSGARPSPPENIQRLTDGSIIITARPITCDNFLTYGQVIGIPESGSILEDQTKPVSVNQGSAKKYPCVAVYETTPQDRHPSDTKISIFVSKPRTEVPGQFDLRVMERHPHSSQLFIPMGVKQEEGFRYLVVVSPPSDPKPRMDNVEAFLTHGKQGVSYGVGTWHAPIVALGKEDVQFAVVVDTNGNPQDDTEEVEIEGKVIVVVP
ncbi:ureidoglycolate hydrolase-domain-containing protein [Tuber indicum]|nr:ureidoglycolate hydrolase-domain-containing protein [Tuber indicum]